MLNKITDKLSILKRYIFSQSIIKNNDLFEELFYEQFCKNPNVLDDYLCNLYRFDHKIKFFSFRKFFKLPNTFKQYMKNIKKFYPEFEVIHDDEVIDIGAHHGITTINLANYGAIVHSFEPNPMSFTILEKNIRLNNFRHKPKIYNLAASSEDKDRVIFDLGVRSTAGSLNNLQEKSLLSGEKIEVSSINLDVYLSRIKSKKIKLIKMDCEGSEYSIFRGINNLSIFDYMIVEAHQTANGQPNDLINIFLSKGYEVNQVKANYGAVELYCKKIY